MPVPRDVDHQTVMEFLHALGVDTKEPHTVNNGQVPAEQEPEEPQEA